MNAKPSVMSNTAMDANDPAPPPTDFTPLPAPRSNRPVTLAYRLETLTFDAFFGLFRLIGLEASSAFAGWIGRTFGLWVKPVSDKGARNLRYVFPDMAPREVRAILREVWENLARTAAEMAHIQKLCTPGADARIEVVNGERLEQIARGAGPAIFVSSHSANWEVLAPALGAAGIDYGMVYRPANNPLVDERIIRIRAAAGSRLQIPKGAQGARLLVETLRAGRSLALLVDQKLNNGVEAPFLGRPAMTAPATARLALKFHAPVIPISLERLSGARFRLTVEPDVPYTSTDDLTADVFTLTCAINKAVGRAILAHPGQWLWLHRRWKTR